MRIAKLVALLAGIAVIAVGSVVLAAETKSKPAAAAKSKPASTTKKTSKPAAATKSAKSAKTAKAAPVTKGAPKTLEEITIEGEVKLPEVLFITSRDIERPLDWLDGYLSAETSAAARAENAPVVVHVVPASPSDSAAVDAPVGNKVTVNPATENAP